MNMGDSLLPKLPRPQALPPWASLARTSVDIIRLDGTFCMDRESICNCSSRRSLPCLLAALQKGAHLSLSVAIRIFEKGRFVRTRACEVSFCFKGTSCQFKRQNKFKKKHLTSWYLCEIQWNNESLILLVPDLSTNLANLMMSRWLTVKSKANQVLRKKCTTCLSTAVVVERQTATLPEIPNH